MGKTGEDWDGLHLGKFEKRRPTFFQTYVSLYQNIIYTAGKSFSVVMWPWFCKWKTLALPIWRLELITDKIKSWNRWAAQVLTRCGIRMDFMHQSIPAVSMPPPPGQPPGISIFWKKWANSRGVGAHELSKCPGVGTKKEGKCPAPEIFAFQHFCSFYINRWIRSALKPTSKPFNNEKVRRLLRRM